MDNEKPKFFFRTITDYGPKGVVYHFPKEVLIIAVIVLIICVTADILIVFTIFKRKTLHSRPYTYVAHLCICNILTVLHIYNILLLNPKVKFTCSWEETIYIYTYFIFITGNELFICVLIIDWYILVFDPQKNSSFRFGKSFIVWFVIIIFIFYTLSVCTFHRFMLNISIAVFVITYFVSLIIVIIIYVLRLTQLKPFAEILEQSKLEFRVVFPFFVCWFLNVSLLLIDMNFKISGRRNEEITPYLLYQISIFVGFSYSLVLLGILCKCDSNFNKSIRSLFNCTTEQANNEENHFELPQII